ncbi:uncharacterized protein LOC120330794 isoform X1 [Styela clava]
MAASSEDKPGTTWELSKENVKPVKSGRNVGCISAVLQPSKQDMERILKEKQLFEEEIIAGTKEDDPIEPWDRYLKWTIQYFPSGGNDHTLLNLLKKMIAQFKSEKYKNDIRYVNAWIKIAEIMKDPIETYSYMNTEGIGSECADFYIAWAEEYEKHGDIRRADRIYNDGDEKCAQPRDLMQRKHMEFQLRVARGMLNGQNNEYDEDDDNDNDLETQQRTTLGHLKGRGKHQTVGTQRTGRALHAIQNKSLKWGTSSQNFVPQSGGKFEIFEDVPSDGISVMGETGKWTSAPSSTATKENTVNPGQWKGVKIKQHHTHSSAVPQVHRPPVSNNFTIFTEEDSVSAHHAPHKVASNIESILSTKKESKISVTEFESIFNAKPIHEANIVSGYDVDKVYTAMGEMQFEEVRAAHWRRRKRIQAQKELEKGQRMLEEQRLERERMMLEQERRFEEERRLLDEEKRLLDEERMKIIKLEREKIRLERKLIESKRLRMLAKSTTAVEDEEALLREEEDITVQLNTVKRDIKKANMAQEEHRNDEADFCATNTAPQSGFVIYDESLQEENQPDQVVQQYPVMSKTTVSANSSLNQSKRSQPSPTLYTKEAMSQLDTWFQKPLENDDCVSDSVVVPEGLRPYRDVASDENQTYGFRPILNETQQLSQGFLPPSEINRAPFSIYTDENVNTKLKGAETIEERRNLLQGINHRTQPLQVYSDVHNTENNKYSDDKTGICFDDVTVSGSDFSSRAHLASTPFCSKSEKLQDMTHINHLSRIQTENTVTDMLPHRENVNEQSEDRIGKSSAPSVNPISIHNDYDENTNDMFYSAENGKEVDIPAEMKQLSPILEASNESDKSSVMGKAKSSCGESVYDRTHDPLLIVNNDPLKMKSFGSDLSKTNNFDPLTNGTVSKTNDILDFMDFGGTIDCGLWESPQAVKPPSDAFSIKPDDNVFISQKILKENTEIEKICTDFSSTSIKKADFEAESIAQSSLPNIIDDPWNKDLLNSIMEHHNNLSNIKDTEIHHMATMPMPSIRKGSTLNLNGKNVKLGQMIGEGAFAKVFYIASNENDCQQVLKFSIQVETPSCPWEVYIINQAKTRLRLQGMSDVADAIVNINSAYLYKDGSLLTLPHYGKGTLLDKINANKNVMMKDATARWIANQLMRIVHSLHTVGIIHGDIKPDNFMVVPLSSDCSDSLTEIGGIKLIDFGRSIDMNEMPYGSSFIKNCCTSAFICVQMQNKEPWNYHIDLYGIAGSLHVVLFGSYMKIRKNQDGKWEIQNKIKRWFHKSFWANFFSTLLNFPTPTKERPITLSDSPLPQLISELEMMGRTDRDAVRNFFNM